MIGLAQPAGGAVPEFLYQLTKMLTDNNREVIEWSNGMIKVHNPPKLESQVLHKYFRHSKFSSFQRQLNYFGFRKLAGKGKMAPCSYVNESTGKEINSLLKIKRKTGATIPSKEEEKSRSIKHKPPEHSTEKPAKVLPPPTRMEPVSHSSLKQPNQPASSSQLALARSAVGRGIRHGITLSSKSTPVTDAAQVPDPLLQQRSDSLSQLASNYQHSLDEYRSHGDVRSDNEHYEGRLSRDSSLVDLAMIPSLDDVGAYQHESTTSTKDEFGWGFVDFPYPELDPSSNAEQR
ncbi:hypothetical protein FisN_4Hh246 [Fistulifera solaris]|uniref:HSF-type DNA-binding domain-containing protein n=1 Tax=Fistulifera solaris TaxID=1519565 RepID=A0A1Z5KFF7_FISSO|nr:hypothetical protein FisN_4Hh246 [Fistulifera solaris]|eukprot:GAX24688.1 hypothetical protein FisN_4Hh246 [Fistulifera solaris]